MVLEGRSLAWCFHRHQVAWKGTTATFVHTKSDLVDLDAAFDKFMDMAQAFERSDVFAAISIEERLSLALDTNDIFGLFLKQSAGPFGLPATASIRQN